MPKPGYPGIVLVATNQVASVRRYRLSSGASTEDVTVGGGTGATATAPTLTTISGTIEAFLEPGDAAQQALVAGAIVDIQLRPEGTGSGLPQRQITGAVVTSVDEDWQPSSHNAVSFTFENGTEDRTAQV